MATTYRLRRKTFANSVAGAATNGGDNKKSGVGKKIGLGVAGTTALAGATALAAMRGKGNLHMSTFKNWNSFKTAAGKTFKNAETGKLDLFGKGTGALRGGNLWKGVTSGAQGAVNVGKRGWDKAKGLFNKGNKGTATQA